MKKIIIILAMILLCVAALGATYVLTRNTYIEAPNLLPNATATNSTPINGDDKDNNSAGTIYFEIIYERNNSVLGLKFNSQTSITDANVSLYQVDRNNLSDKHLLNIPGNPSSSANEKKSGHGGIYYKFENVPYGDYYIIAEKGGNTRELSIILNAASDGNIFGTKVFNPDLR